MASVGVYLWKKDIIQTNRAYEKNLEERGGDLGIDSIKTFSILDRRISAAKEILKNHYDILAIFSYLEKNTLGDAQGEVTLRDISIKEEGNMIHVTATGRAAQSDDVQRQSKGYAVNPNISNLFLSELSKSKTGSYWEFNLSFDVDKKFLTERAL